MADEDEGVPRFNRSTCCSTLVVDGVVDGVVAGELTESESSESSSSEEELINLSSLSSSLCVKLT